jgi:hypothetical protein
MANSPEDIDYGVYGTPGFERVLEQLFKYSNVEFSRSKDIIKSLSSNGALFEPYDKRELQSDVKLLEKDRARLYAIAMKIGNKGKVSIREIEKIYDSYCYALAMLTAHNDKWDAVASSDFIKKVLVNVKIVDLIYTKIGAGSKDIEKALIALEKARKKAEKAKYKSYIKAGLSVALDVATLVSPHVRAMSAIGKLAIGQSISIGSTLVLGKPEDFVGQALGNTVSATEIMSGAQDYKKSAKALGLAGKALSIDGYAGSAKEIKDARAVVDQIEAKMAELKRVLVAKAKFMEKMAKEFENAQSGIIHLVKRVQSNAAKAGNARAEYQKYKALRDKL